MSQVLNHLLFHKAMVGSDTEKIDQYIEIANSASSAAEVATVEGSIYKKRNTPFHAGQGTWARPLVTGYETPDPGIPEICTQG